MSIALLPTRRSALLGSAVALLALGSRAEAGPFIPGDLVVSRSVYAGDTGAVTVGQTLPPGAVTGGVPAIANGTYPGVFNNNTVDGSFGVTAPIYLDQYAVSGGVARLGGTIAVPTGSVVTSFPSKSELALNLSADRRSLTFAGYIAPVNALDVSNSNTVGAVDPTNPVPSSYQRAVAQIDAAGRIAVTPTSAYSGNNQRAVIAANGVYYAAGNAGNGGNPQPDNVTATTGVQLITPGTGANQRIGDFNVTQYGYPADKQPKDNNFRGETIFGNTLFVSKGSGGNGINTVYQVGAAGRLPTAADGLGAPITILPGFPTELAKTNSGQFYPFGLFFADANTLYVADEGPGDTTADPHAGLEKWTLSGGKWNLDYTLQNGLALNTPYDQTGHDIPGLDIINPVTGASYEPANNGLRNITGQVNADGTVTIYGVTSTVSGSGDQGADPNQLVAITDLLSATSLPTGEAFTVLATAGFGEVLRGVSFAPVAAPEPASLAALATALGALSIVRRRRVGEPDPARP